MSAVHFDDLVLELNNTKILKSGFTPGVTNKFQPGITSDDFEFRVRLRQNSNSVTGNFLLGIIDENHQFSSYGVGGIGKIGWGLWIGHGQKHSPNISYGSTNHTKGHNTGIFGFQVRKKKKEILLLEEGKEPIVLWDKVVFPKTKLHISFSFNSSPGDAELISFIDHEMEPLFNEKKLSLESQERFDFLLEQSNFKLPLRNKTLNLWRSFLRETNIPTEVLNTQDEYRGLFEDNFHSDVDESVILRIHLGIEWDVEDHNKRLFLEYFDFFRRLEMKREMSLVIDKLREIEKFEDLFELFRVCVERLEKSKELKSWFTLSPEKIDDVLFRGSITLAVFNSMKRKESLLKPDSAVMMLPGSNVVTYHLKNYDLQTCMLGEHDDFKDTNYFKKELRPVSSTSVLTETKKKRGTYRTLYDDLDLYALQKKENGILSNNKALVTLKSCDGEEVVVHPEILIWRSSFFFRMIRFGGSEAEDMKTTGKIQLSDLAGKELRLLVRFYYTEEVDLKETSIESLIRCVVHTHKFFEEEVTEILLKYLEKRAKWTEESSVKKMRMEEELVKCAPLLLNETLKMHVIRRLCDGSGVSQKKLNVIVNKATREDFTEKLIRKSKRENEVMKKELLAQMSKLIERVKKVEESNKKLVGICKRQDKKIKTLEMALKVKKKK